jgi:hypothetical protein
MENELKDGQSFWNMRIILETCRRSGGGHSDETNPWWKYGENKNNAAIVLSSAIRRSVECLGDQGRRAKLQNELRMESRRK